MVDDQAKSVKTIPTSTKFDYMWLMLAYWANTSATHIYQVTNTFRCSASI